MNEDRKIELAEENEQNGQVIHIGDVNDNTDHVNQYDQYWSSNFDPKSQRSKKNSKNFLFKFLAEKKIELSSEEEEDEDIILDTEVILKDRMQESSISVGGKIEFFDDSILVSEEEDGRDMGLNWGNVTKICKIGKIQFIFGPSYQWITPVIFLMIGVFATVYLEYYALNVVFYKRPWLLVGYWSGLGFFVLALVMTAFREPGYRHRVIPFAKFRKVRDDLYCTKCFTYESHDVVHCHECDICIEGYDHHCPVLGNCIGKNNLLWFRLNFVGIMGGLIILYLLLFVSLFESENFNSKENKEKTKKILNLFGIKF